MLEAGDHVIAGISGGADSVFLFYVLAELREEMQLDLTAVHVHHGIRGEEADRDAGFVRKLCEDRCIPCVIFRRDVPAEAEKRGMSVEEAGRAVRYEVFREQAEKAGGAKIALAHHRDDLAETVLFRILRGTGIAGLAAMKPVSGSLIRPLLCVTKAEITDCLRARGFSWCEDSTNRHTDAARNRLRLTILPLIREEVNAGASEHLAALSGIAGEAYDFIRTEAERRAERLVSASGDGAVLVSAALEEEMPAMRQEILRIAVSRAGSVKDVGRRQIEDLLALMGKQTGAKISLPHGLIAQRDYGGIRLAGETAAPEKAAVKIELPDEGEERFAVFGDLTLRTRRVTGAFCTLPDAFSKQIDYDTIKDTLVLRTRRDGDWLTIDGEGHRKSLSDYFTDEKVPRQERDRIPLVADGQEIVWVIGKRLGARYRITQGTENALELEVLQKESD